MALLIWCGEKDITEASSAPATYRIVKVVRVKGITQRTRLVAEYVTKLLRRGL